MVLIGILAGFLLYLEVVYHIGCFGFWVGNPIFALSIGLALAALEALLVGKLPGRWKKVSLWTILGVEYLLFTAQFVYLQIFKQPLLIDAAVQGGGDALTNYWREALDGIFHALPYLVLMALPLPVIGLLLHWKKWKLSSFHSLQVVRSLLLTSAGIGLCIVTLLIGKYIKADYYEDYTEFFDPLTVAQDMGITTMVQRDVAVKFDGLLEGVWSRVAKSDTGKGRQDSLASGNKDGGEPGFLENDFVEELPADASMGMPQGADAAMDDPALGAGDGTPDGDASQADPLSEGEEPAAEEPEVDTSFQELPIDWAKLAEEADSEEESWLAEYMQGLVPTRKNEYTGLFRGYNLIFLTAEGFSPYAVREDITPTLYRLTHSGFVFTNYYVPLWQTSTSDGEYVNTTGLIPDGQFSMKNSKDNDMAFSLPRYFAKLGYGSMAYHNNSLSYYDRYLSHNNLGYIFKAARLGNLDEATWGKYILPMEHPNAWPASDLEMLQSSLPEYVGQDGFHVYYMTVSGHMNYNFTGNAMSAKNQDAVADLPMSENARAYIACHVELDKALEYLLKELEAAGKLENTVICMSADHYPYAMEPEQYEELAGKDVSKNLDTYRSNLILWNASMEGEPVIVDKVCGSMDLMPTLLNLFGFDYDSRLFAGKDIFSQDEGMVIFNDRSFITDTLVYDRKQKTVSFRSDLEASGDLTNDIAGYTEERGLGGILEDYQKTHGEQSAPVRIAGSRQQLEGGEAREEYLSACQQEVKDRYQFSAYILRSDYYHAIKEALPEELRNDAANPALDWTPEAAGSGQEGDAQQTPAASQEGDSLTDAP